MKKTLKILSVLCALVLLIGTVSVGMTAYAVSDDAIGSYDFTITNPYKDIVWETVNTYKAETHVHTVRSDADTEVDDMIHYYYDDFGIDAMALTDHGTVNYGWDHDQGRVVVFDYQFFVHGAIDNLTESDYKNIITGARNDSTGSPRGYGMMEIPLGNEMNGMSTNKCHVNGYYADAMHGNVDPTMSWPRYAVEKNYDAGGFSHINHVGEWSEGNDSPTVYTKDWLEDFASIYKTYCPNRGGRGAANQGTAGVIGMELVNTADSRTHNDRRYVYDEILKILAPQGINVFGFCEDDSHEYSDCDRNAQYVLINNDKDVRIDSTKFDASNNESGKTSDYKNNNNDPMDKVQNYYREALFYGEFYASSKNSKNSYELGNGFNAVGAYPSISNITVNQDKDQISVTFKDATKIRMVADGNIIATVNSAATQNTVVFDLNRYEDQINSYVRIYLTGAGGITYLQPFLVTKEISNQSKVHFVDNNGNPLADDVTLVVKDSSGVVVSDSCTYEGFYYTLGAGEYTYTASRRGYLTTENKPFTITQAQIDEGGEIPINVILEESTDVTYAYFYAPETIYVTPDDNKTFDKYVDRANAVNGALNTTLRDEGNIFFQREGAENLKLRCNIIESSEEVLLGSIVVGETDMLTIPAVAETSESEAIPAGTISYSGNTISTSVTAGALQTALSNNGYVLLMWTASYTLNGRPYESHAYSYVYKTPTGASSVLAAGGQAKTKKNISWEHESMYAVATLYIFGIQKITPVGTLANNSYKYAPSSGNVFVTGERSITDPGTGYYYKAADSNGGSVGDSSSHGVWLVHEYGAYVYADRSRINDWSDIPYLRIGLDINSAEQATGKNGGNACARLVFNANETSVRDGSFNNDTSAKTLYDLEFSSQSNYTIKTDYNLSDSDVSTTSGTVSKSLRSFVDTNGGRVYYSDNNDSSRTIKLALPSASAPEVTIPVSAYVKGTKESRIDAVSMQINLTLVNVDKAALRTELNNVVKEEFQKDWFATDALYEEYQSVIRKAARILGDPTSTAEEIEASKLELQGVYDKFELKESSMTVRYYWKLNGTEGEIYSEPTVYGIDYTEDITVNAPTISGYTFADEFVCYANDGSGLYEIDRGTDDFDTAFVEHDIYVWVFYYTPDSFTVSYDAGTGVDYTPKNSDETPAATTAYFGMDYTVAANKPQMTGYEFEKWVLETDNATIEDEYKSHSSGDTFSWDWVSNGTFMAQYTPNEYNITYDVNGGNPLRIPNEFTKVTFNDNYYVFGTAPSRTGYNFAGWLLNNENICSPNQSIYWEFAEDSTFVAQWTLAQPIVTFDKNADDAVLKDKDGNVLADDYSIQVNCGEPYGELPTAVRTGYTTEWYYDPNFSAESKVTPNTNVVIESDHTLKAKWNAIDYTISYVLNGGSDGGSNPASYTVATDTFTLNEPVKSGYEFKGWTGSNGTTAQKTVEIAKGSTGNRTYTANWGLKEYKITYILNGGVNDANNPTIYTYNSDAITILPPTKTGYRFTEWKGTNGTSLGASVTIPAGSTGDREYTANWDLEIYTITYDYNGIEDPHNNPTSYSIENTAITLKNPEKAGYTFSGWECDNDSLSGETVTITPGEVTGNLKFKALWTKDGNKKITYILNGGKVEGTNRTEYEYGETFTLINPKRDGYTFKGWTKKVGSAAPEAATMTATVLGTEGAEITFTATWEEIEYTIAYNLDKGRIAAEGTNPTTYTPETDAFTLINPIKPGYTFKGWTGTGLTTTSNVVTVAKGSTGNRSYTANWKVNTYTVAYDLAGGTDAGFIKSYTSATTATIGAPIRTGYTFTGWDVSYVDLAWNEGTTITSAGKFASQTGANVSDGIVLRSGATYTVGGSASDVKIYAFNKSGAFLGEFSGSYTPTEDSVVYLTSSSDKLDTVELTLSGSTPSSVAITKETDSVLGSAGNMKLTANWTRNEYTITYNGLEGATITGGVNPSTYNSDSDDIYIYNPTKAGHNFVGWTGTGLSAPSTNVVIKSGSEGNREYTAEFEPINYTITYVGVDGMDLGNPASYNINSSDITLNNPASEAKTGCTFAGWTGTGLSGVTSTVTIAAGSTGNKTYTASWTPINYTITYNLDGGKVAKDNPQNYNVTTETFTLTNPTKDGADFAGWKETEDGPAALSVTIAKGSTGDRSYTATWNYNEYHINYYNLNGAIVENPATYTVKSAKITLNNPSITGYNFKGWTGTGLSDASMSVTIAAGSTGDRDYTANWEIINYTIDYELNGGQVAENANPTSYNVETPTITLVNPVKEGYTFTGWTGSNGSTPVKEVKINKGSTEYKKFTANWTANSYNITYSGIEGAEFFNENKTTYTIDDEFTIYNPTKTGYHFDGWSGTGIKGTGISDNVVISKGSTGDRAYKANWSLETYHIYYQLGGGTVAIDNPETYNYLSAPITLNNPVRTGYEFDGWENDYNDEKELVVTIPTNSTGDKTFFATWSEGIYTITLNTDGGTLPSGQEASITYRITDTVTIQNPTKEGYTFAGWTGTGLGIGGSTKNLVIPTGSTGNREYTALWTEGQNIIEYNLNGGEVVNGTNPNSYFTSSDESERIKIINPTRTGYTFNGWSYDGSTEGTVEYNKSLKVAKIVTSVPGTVKLTADWKQVKYSITYNLNGGSVESNATEYYIESDPIKLNNPTRSGYKFNGWSGTGLNGNKYTDVTVKSGSTGNRNYTANWLIEEYTITYNYGEGSVGSTPNPTSFDVTTPTFTLINPTWEGHIFAGWKETETGPAILTVTIPTGSTGSRSYVATYETEEYSITYAGIEDADFTKEHETYTVDDSFTIGVPHKEGYEFTGWKSADSVNPVMTVRIETGTTGDKKYTAQWSPIAYTITYAGLEGATVTDENPTQYTIESTKIVLTNPTKSGYEFVGWTEKDVDKNEVVDAEPVLTKAIPTGSTGNKEFTANWVIGGYTITYSGLEGATVSGNPTTYRSSDIIALNLPTKEGCRFAGWTGTDLEAPTLLVTIPAGSTGDRSYTATWTEITGTHKVYFYGYQGYPIILDPATGINYVEVRLGQSIPVTVDELGYPAEIDGCEIEETVGYKISGWDKDFNSSYYKYLEQDIEVHAKWVVDPTSEKYTVTVVGTQSSVTSCVQYEKFTAKTDSYNSKGEPFRYWTIAEKDSSGKYVPGEVVSYYRDYTFFVHCDSKLMAIYGKSSDTRATTRVSYIEDYDSNYDWFTVYSEKNVGTEYTLVNAGVIFTTDSSIGGNESGFRIGESGVYNAVSTNTGLTGMWTLSIKNPNHFGVGATFYIRSYVIVADSSGKTSTIYSSSIKTYLNDKDPSA